MIGGDNLDLNANFESQTMIERHKGMHVSSLEIDNRCMNISN